MKTSYVRTQTTVYLRTYPTIQFCGSVTIPVRTYIPIPKQSIPLLYSSWVNTNLAKWETTELKRGNQPEQGREQRKTPSLGTCKHLSLPCISQTHNHCVNVLHASSVAELKTTQPFEVHVNGDSHDSRAHVQGMLVSLHPPSKKHFAISYWICRADHSLARSGITIW